MLVFLLFFVRNLKTQDGGIANGSQRYLEEEVPSKKSRVSENQR